MKILLHICCAPCVIHPLRELAEKRNNSITGFFYNPNIHPRAEMEKRRQAVADYANEDKFEVLYGEYDMENFFKNIGATVDAPRRCQICWKMRLAKTAERAKKEGFDAFTTTLLVSPYQDREKIIKIGSALGEELGVRFLGEDFRSGFKEAQLLARERGIYRQKYCGCIFSEKERHNKTTDRRPQTTDQKP